MKRFTSMLFLLSIALPAGAVDSADLVLTEVRVLGHLNGQALACSHHEVAARIKALMIKLSPKSRLYGEAFETATNEGFITQAKNDQATCPGGPLLAEQVEEEAKRLQSALAVVVPK